MNTNKLISSLCYFSIFFAGFIFPIAVYFVVDSHEVKSHAKVALFSHLIPLITIPLIFIPAIFVGMIDNLVPFILIVSFTVIVNIAVAVWNIVKGIKVLVGE